jgi:Protein of unknown function (DUF2034)
MCVVQCRHVSSKTIPRDIREFVARFLPSVEHLETFMVLRSNTTRTWSAAEIATELSIAESAAVDVLEQLASDNFLDVRISNDILYRFNPATAALKALSTSCADLYVRQRIRMINLVTASSVSPTHDFTEAFRLKKDTDRG